MDARGGISRRSGTAHRPERRRVQSGGRGRESASRSLQGERAGRSQSRHGCARWMRNSCTTPPIMCSTARRAGLYGRGRPHPLGAYAVSKLAGELRQAYLDKPLIIRTSGVFGPGGLNTARGNFIETMLRQAAAGRTIRAVGTTWRRPRTLLSRRTDGRSHRTRTGRRVPSGRRYRDLLVRIRAHEFPSGRGECGPPAGGCASVP